MHNKHDDKNDDCDAKHHGSFDVSAIGKNDIQLFASCLRDVTGGEDEPFLVDDNSTARAGSRFRGDTDDGWHHFLHEGLDLLFTRFEFVQFGIGLRGKSDGERHGEDEEWEPGKSGRLHDW